MKILFTQKMSGISGSELYLLQIMPELKNRGFDVEMLLFFPTRSNQNKVFVSYLNKAGVKTHEIYGHKSVSPFLIRKVAKLIKENEYDLVQSNLVHADFLMAMVKMIYLPKMKLISVKHGYNPVYLAKYGYDFRYLKRDVYYWIERIACRFIDFNVTISKGLYNAFREGGITKPSKLKNIYYGLTVKAPAYENGSLKLPSGPFVMITGRLIPFKGHEYLIRAWKEVKERTGGLKLLIAGDGALRESLQQLVDENDLSDTVIFLGHVPNPHPVMEKCVFTMVTSIWEGFGLIQLESWLHKKPIIAFDAPAMNEVIEDGKTGLLVPLKDEGALAEKIIQLYNDPEAIRRLGEAGHKRLMSFFTLQRMTDEMQEVYTSLHQSLPVPLD